MEWLILVALAGGFAAGWFARQFSAQTERDSNTVRRELEKTQFELEQYKQEVNDHFAQTAELLEEATESYRKMYRQVADGASALLETSPVALPKFAEEEEAKEEASDTEALPPRDYANTRHGLIRDKEQQPS